MFVNLCQNLNRSSPFGWHPLREDRTVLLQILKLFIINLNLARRTMQKNTSFEVFFFNLIDSAILYYDLWTVYFFISFKYTNFNISKNILEKQVEFIQPQIHYFIIYSRSDGAMTDIYIRTCVWCVCVCVRMTPSCFCYSRNVVCLIFNICAIIFRVYIVRYTQCQQCPKGYWLCDYSKSFLINYSGRGPFAGR